MCVRSQNGQLVKFMLNRLIFFVFCLVVFSLPFVRPFYFNFSGLKIQLTEILFFINFLILLVYVYYKHSTLKLSKVYLIFAFYLITFLISAIFSVSAIQSYAKLAGTFYLVGLFFLAYNVIDTEQKLKMTIIIWLTATFIVSFLGTITVLLFYIQPENFLLNYTLHHYGTLIPGNYPRIQSTFFYPAMLCNYLSLSLAFLFAAREFRWINDWIFYILLFLISITLIFTITPGLGGIAIIIGIVYWKFFENRKFLSKFALTAGIFVAAAFFSASVFSPVQTPTSPYFFNFPFVEKRIDPSVRLLAWQTSAETFLENPLTGKGIGTPVAYVDYVSASGFRQHLSDAHQIWLNVAAQAGIFGLAAILLITFYFSKQSLTFLKNKNSLRFYFAAAFFGTFVFQGLVGSFEDARHLWIFFGLFAAVCLIENDEITAS